jgi:hypothetical protein
MQYNISLIYTQTFYSDYRENKVDALAITLKENYFGAFEKKRLANLSLRQLKCRRTVEFLSRQGIFNTIKL